MLEESELVHIFYRLYHNEQAFFACVLTQLFSKNKSVDQ